MNSHSARNQSSSGIRKVFPGLPIADMLTFQFVRAVPLKAGASIEPPASLSQSMLNVCSFRARHKTREPDDLQNGFCHAEFACVVAKDQMPNLKIHFHVALWAWAADEHVAFRRRLQRVGPIIDAAIDQRAFAGMADASPACPFHRNVACFG